MKIRGQESLLKRKYSFMDDHCSYLNQKTK